MYLIQATDDADTVVQISTPIGKKRRRISTDTGMKLQRLSMIPKLERSFCLTEENFEVQHIIFAINVSHHSHYSLIG